MTRNISEAPGRAYSGLAAHPLVPGGRIQFLTSPKSQGDNRLTFQVYYYIVRAQKV